VKAASASLRRVAAFVIVFAALAAAPAWAQKPDKVQLSNGDVLTCEVKLLDKGRLQVSTDDLGTVYIEWDKVVSVTAPGLFYVETSSGLRLLGQLATILPGQLDVIQQTGPVSLDRISVVLIAPIGQRWWNRIDGAASLGLSYSQSSGVAQLSFSANALYRRPNVQMSASASSFFTRQEEADDTSRHALDLGWARSFGTGSLWLVQGGFMRNEELGYTLRSTVSGAIGHYLARSNRAIVAVGGGLSTSRELPVEGDATQNLEALITARQSFFTYDSPKTDIATVFNLYPSLSQWGRVRLEFDGRFNREIVKDFTIGITIYDSYDSEPPTEGARKNDVGFSLTIGWTF
jgi:hypothetical protein